MTCIIGPQGVSGLPLLSLVDNGDDFPAWSLKSRDGNLLLRLMYQKLSWTNLSEFLDAAIITGVSFTPLSDPQHVILSIIAPLAYIMSDAVNIREFKKAHRIVTAVTETTAANDRLYGFQAAPAQATPPATVSPHIFKSATCCTTAISIPLSKFHIGEVCCQWEASHVQLKSELGVTARHEAAVAVAWLWLDSCIKAGASKKH